ncbi:MAG: hypothetical protein ACLQKK_01035 [Rhodomicrobium sp.]
MAESHIISALKTKREELQCAIGAYEGRLKKAKYDLASVTATLRVFGDEAEEPLLRRQSLFPVRELPRLIFDALRKRQDCLDTGEIVDAVMKASGMDAGDSALRKRVFHSVSNTLLYLAKKQKVAAGDLRGRLRVWRLA